MIEGHIVNLRAFLSRLINKHSHGVTDNMQKNFGLALSFVGKLLLCSRRLSFVDAQAIGIVSQIKYGDNPASLILAETLSELDLGIPGGKGRKPFTPMDTNSTSIRNMLLGLEMAD
ncbi:hypothetical protein SO802_029574 [Lithocarpus litseifolius]|uniref:Uncharacterized protein n=1 Tax=Lithocarpus litseifolius TaxID=425828 RepID=A0AAW2BWS3_9ROSI